MGIFRALRQWHPFRALGKFVQEHTIGVIIYSLVGNTALAQLFYNSAGLVLPSQDWRTRYLIFSAFLSMIAFSLFELHVVRQLKMLLSLAKEIRQHLASWEIPAHIVTLLVISAYNVYSLFLLNAAIWPSLEATVTGHPVASHVNLPELPGVWKYLSHALFYSLILFLAAVVVERKKSAAELAAEEDEQLHRDTIDGSNAYYRELINRGGRNVVAARQVLSPPEVAAKQARLLAALEGKLDPQATTPSWTDASTTDVEPPEVEVQDLDEDALPDEDELHGIVPPPPRRPYNHNRTVDAIAGTVGSNNHGRQ